MYNGFVKANILLTD